MCWWPDGTGEKTGIGGIVIKTDKIVVESFGFLSYNLGRKLFPRRIRERGNRTGGYYGQQNKKRQRDGVLCG